MANNLVLDNQLDLANHPYCLIFDIEKLYPRKNKSMRKIRVDIIYDHYIWQGYTRRGYIPEIRQTIYDISWSHNLRERVLLLKDMNDYSTDWNPYYVRRQNTRPLKELIDNYQLIVNNNTDFCTWFQNFRISIINSNIIIAHFGPLML